MPAPATPSLETGKAQAPGRLISKAMVTRYTDPHGVATE